MRVAPRTGLILLFVLAGTGGLALTANEGLYWMLAGVACAAAVDIFISRSQAGPAVVFPDLVPMAKNRPGTFCVTIAHFRPGRVKIGIMLPENRFRSPYEQAVVVKDGTAHIDWPATGIKQGRYLLDACHVETESRFGLWAVRQRLPLNSEFRVYPDMMPERRALAALFPDMGLGAHAQKSVGKGREFERLREYLPGDSYEDIHWKATARRGVPVTKIYQIERTQDVYVLIDAARMSSRNAPEFSHKGDGAGPEPTHESILEKYITAALALGMAAERQGDRFGIGVFSDRMERFIPAGGSRAHHTACRDALYTLEPRRATPDFTECITFIGNKIRKRALLIILTTLDDAAIADSLLDNIHILSRRHLVVVNMLKPRTAYPVFSSQDIGSVDDIYARLSGHYLWQFLRECQGQLHRQGIGFFLHPYREFTLKTVSHYLALKKRQVL